MSARFSLLAAAAAILAVSGAACAQTPSPASGPPSANAPEPVPSPAPGVSTPATVSAVPITAAAKALLAAEDLRFEAELKHDVPALGRMTADDVVYSHFTGQRQDKAAILQGAAHAPFQSITPSDRYARVIGDVGIVRGKVARQLPGRTLTDGYLAIYVRRAGRWQLLEWVTASPQNPSKP